MGIWKERLKAIARTRGVMIGGIIGQREPKMAKAAGEKSSGKEKFFFRLLSVAPVHFGTNRSILVRCPKK